MRAPERFSFASLLTPNTSPPQTPSSVFLGTLGSSSRITSTREFLMRVIWLREDVGTILVVGSSIEMNEIPHDATMKRISVEMLWKFTAMDEVAGVSQTLRFTTT